MAVLELVVLLEQVEQEVVGQERLVQVVERLVEQILVVVEEQVQTILELVVLEAKVW
jgi:hypothetical protein